MHVAFFLLILAAASPAVAQDSGTDAGVRSEAEIPNDMPPPPDDAPPAEAPPTGGTEERPPHPETPQPLQEAQPTAETLAKTKFHWLPGHWVWTGKEFEWKTGEWIYKVSGYVLIPPRWEWNDQWVFHNAGWAKSGSKEIVFRPTPAASGDAATNPQEPPPGGDTQVKSKPATTTVYVYTGVYVAPLILYPIWHPWYHYHWYYRHPYYGRPPAYRSRRYHYATTHRPYYNRPPSGRPPGGRPPSGRPPSGRPPSGRPPNQGGHPGTKPAQPVQPNRPSTRPSQPSTRPSQPSTRPSQPSTRPSSPSQKRTRPSSPSRSGGSRSRSGGARPSGRR